MSAQAQAPKKLTVHVVSQEGAIFEGEATAVFIKGSEGELGLYPGHSQLLTQVAPGPVRILAVGENLVKDSKDDNRNNHIFLTIKFLEKNSKNVILKYMKQIIDYANRNKLEKRLLAPKTIDQINIT